MEIEINESLSEHERFKAGQVVIKLNRKRSDLMAGINKLLGIEDYNIKTY